MTGRLAYTGPARAGAWSGSAFIGAIVVILIVLGVILYGLSKTITDTANITTSAPRGIAHCARQQGRRYRLRRRATDSAPFSSLVTGRACRSWSALRICGE